MGPLAALKYVACWFCETSLAFMSYYFLKLQKCTPISFFFLLDFSSSLGKCFFYEISHSIVFFSKLNGYFYFFLIDQSWLVSCDLNEERHSRFEKGKIGRGKEKVMGFSWVLKRKKDQKVKAKKKKEVWLVHRLLYSFSGRILIYLFHFLFFKKNLIRQQKSLKQGLNYIFR